MQGYKTVNYNHSNNASPTKKGPVARDSTGKITKSPEKKQQTILLEDLVGMGDGLDGPDETQFPYDAHLQKTGAGSFKKELYRDFDVDFHKKVNLADCSGNMDNVELV